MEDKQINELEKLELEKNKLLLSAENVIGFSSTIALASSIIRIAIVPIVLFSSSKHQKQPLFI